MGLGGLPLLVSSDSRFHRPGCGRVLSHGGDDCELCLGRVVALQGGFGRCTNVAVRLLETRSYARDRTVTARTDRTAALARDPVGRLGSSDLA
jgi:hypothetical protein